VLFVGNDTFLCEEQGCVQISHALSTFRNLRCTSRTKEATGPLNSSVTGDDRNRHSEYTHTVSLRVRLQVSNLPWSLAECR
jgi:hypothetical protein